MAINRRREDWTLGRQWRLAGAVLVLGLMMSMEPGQARVGNNPAGPSSATAAVYGFSFSPYIDGQDPNQTPAPVIGAGQIQARLNIVAPYTNWIRTFGSSHGLEQTPSIAKGLGLHVAAGAWIGPDLTQNTIEINNLIATAQAGHVDIAIVGSEVLLRNDVTDAQLIAYMNQVRQAVPAGVLVTTADTYDRLIANPNVIAAGDVVMANIYPYWQGVAFSNAICALDAAYSQTVAAANGKAVLISETGWPSAGNAVGAAVPSPANAAAYFSQFVSWASARSVGYFYFAALDEAWKANHGEGPQGAHWGIWTTDGVLKPGMQATLDGQTVSSSCNGLPGGPGTPGIQFTYVPPYGTVGALSGAVAHVTTSDHKVAVYIKVFGGWWTKPTFAQPLTPIQVDGNWSAAIVTGGSDEIATEIAAFLLPGGYDPPQLGGAPAFPPVLLSTALAMVQTARSQQSISGQVVDASSHPLPGVTVSLTGSETGTTTTAPDGKFSFANLASAGPLTLTPSLSGFVFSPVSQNVPTVSGNVIVNFAATAAIADILWRHNTRGEVWLWPMNGTAKLAENFVRTVPDTNWEIRGLGDQNGDGNADILWRNTVTGGIVFWPMNGSTPLAETYVSMVDPAYDIVGTGDYNGDGRSDILWRHGVNGQVWIWLMDGAATPSIVQVDTVNPIYRIDGSGDLNADGRSDIVWRNTNTGDVWVWLMNGTTRLSQTMVGTVPDLGYQIQGVADYTGDDKVDILWRHTTQGHVWLWPMNGAVLVTQTFVGTVDPIYAIKGTGDYNGDGKADILWHHSTVGDVWMWLMDGATMLSQTLVGKVPDVGYQIVKGK